MTDPLSLTNDERIEYIRQLQRTVKYWQKVAASHHGLTWEQLDAMLRAKYKESDKVSNETFATEFDCDWIGDATPPDFRRGVLLQFPNKS